MASVFRAACAVRQRALPMLRGYATGAPRLGAAAALRVQSSAYGSTIWWPDVSSISKHPSVLVPPTHSHSIEELLAAVEMERFHDAEVNGSMLGLVAPKLSDIALEFDLPPATVQRVVRTPPPAEQEADTTVIAMPKRTWQPNRLKRRRTHGFLRRNSTKAGRRVIERRRQKGRWRVTVT